MKPMSLKAMIEYTDTLVIEHALWWFIENAPEEGEARTGLFFHLRERMRNEARPWFATDRKDRRP